MSETDTIAPAPAITKFPWSSLHGTVEGEYATSETILKAANLDWGVECTPTYRYRKTSDAKGKATRKLEKTGNFEIRRTDTDTVLTSKVVSDVYVPFSNQEIFGFADNLVDDGRAKFVAAGEQYGGRKVFLVTKLHEGITIAGNDPHDLFLFFRTGHDGGTALTALVIPFRLTCANAVPLALKTAVVRWSIPHVTTMEGRLQEARQSLELAYDYANEYVKTSEKLLEVNVSDETLRTVLNASVSAKRGNHDDVVDGIISTYKTSEVNGYQGTGLGVVQAITEHFDHVHPRRTDDVRFESIVHPNGEAFTVANRAVRLLTLAA